MTSIGVLIPVLDRPDDAARVARSIRQASVLDVDILFVCSPDDLDEIHAVEETGEPKLVVDWSPGRADYARKINRGAQTLLTDWLLTGADDLEFHPGWDVNALAEAAATGAAVIGTNDLCNPGVMRGTHSTHTLIDAQYAADVGTTFTDGPGVLLHEGYRHQWVDTELVEAARRRGVWAHALDSHVQHLHPICDPGRERDETYMKAMNGQDAQHDRRLFHARRSTFARELRTRGR